MQFQDTRSDPVIAQLDAVVGAPEFAPLVSEVVKRLERLLANAPDAPMTWEALPLATFPGRLPAEIRSGWVFVLRPGTELPPERHSNSHQRSLSLKGTARFELRENERWISYAVTDGAWASAPTGMWHRWFAGPEPLALLSFHTVGAEELVEEHATTSEDFDGPTQGRRYQA